MALQACVGYTPVSHFTNAAQYPGPRRVVSRSKSRREPMKRNDLMKWCEEKISIGAMKSGAASQPRYQRLLLGC